MTTEKIEKMTMTEKIGRALMMIEILKSVDKIKKELAELENKKP